MKHYVLLALISVFIGVSGCAGLRPVLVGESILRRNGATVYSNLDVYVGEVRFQGLYSAVATEADVFIDGKYLFTLRSGGWRSVRVEKLGEHTYLARVRLIQGGSRGEYIGCSQGRFWVDPRYRNSRIYGLWWRLKIPTPNLNC